MAEWEKADALFRFVQVRAPETTRLPVDKRIPNVRAYFPESPTALHTALKVPFGNNATATMLDLGRQFITSPDRTPWNDSKFYASRSVAPKWFAALDDFLLANSDQPVVPELEKALIATLVGNEEFFIDDRIIWRHFETELERLWRQVADSVLAVAIWPFATPESQSALMRSIRVIGVLNQIVDGNWTPPQPPSAKPPTLLVGLITTERIHTSLIDGLVLLPPDLFPLPRQASAAAVPNDRSLREKRSILPAEHMRTKLVRASAELSSALAAEERDHLPTASEVGKRLSGSTIALLATIEESQSLTVPELIDNIEKRIHAEPSVPLPESESAPIAAMRIIAAAPSDHSRVALPPFEQGILSGDWMASNLTRSPVIGDLNVVQQELLRYEAGEIADIQNVLAKEKKLHIHEYKETQETETITTTEHEEDRTHDNQSTDRLELSQESSRQAQSQASLEAGVTFSGQWGPVKIGANTQFSYATSSEESNRSASSFSHEVVDRSVEQIKERRIEQRRVLRRQELLDRNEHKFDNQSDQHVIGIYQWIDKVYEAATFNYGLRMMLDVTVPEPALYWQYASAIATANKVTAKPPPPLTIEQAPGSKPIELKAEHIGTLISIDDLAATYRTRGLKPPPAQWVTAGTKLAPDKPPPDDTTGEKLQGLLTKAADVKIPKGYIPRWYTAAASLLFNARAHDLIDAVPPVGDNRSDRVVYTQHLFAPPPDGTVYYQTLFGQNTLTVGPFVDVLRPGMSQTLTHTFREAQVDNAAWTGESGDVGQEGSLPVAVSLVGSPTFTATVTIVCERSAETFKAWQMEQYEAVVTAWETWNQEFELAVRSAENGASSPSLTTNSALAGSIVTAELRRLFLEMLHVPVLGATGAVDPYDLSDPTKPKPPELHADVAAQFGRQVQFVEQAFEWPQLTYRLYPYYWKPRSVWATAMVLQDADPAFAEFLRAGSARLVVPVRPGFEIAVCSHLGVNPPLPWQAGKPPIVGADPYLSIAEEIKSSQTNIGKPPERIDTPWPVRLPTTLVKLKSDAQLPVYRAPTLLAIQVTPIAPSVANGLSAQFTATGTYADNSTHDLTSQVIWASSNRAVATISNADGSRGLAASASVGSTSISAALGSVSGSTTLTITAP